MGPQLLIPFLPLDVPQGSARFRILHVCLMEASQGVLVGAGRSPTPTVWLRLTQFIPGLESSLVSVLDSAP